MTRGRDTHGGERPATQGGAVGAARRDPLRAGSRPTKAAGEEPGQEAEVAGGGPGGAGPRACWGRKTDSLPSPSLTSPL